MKTKKEVFIGLAVLLFLLLFVAAAAIALAPTASADPGWDYYRQIEIDHSKVNGTADLSSFPVLIKLTETWLVYENTAGHVRQANGYDIVFTDSINANKLDYEIEEYNGTAGTLVAWVRIPTLSPSTNTTIRLYYGNSAASDWSNATGVWDTNYKGVWHLLGDGTTTLPDATSYSNTGTKKAVGEPANTASGQIDGAQDFDGTNDYVDLSDQVPPENITVSAWIKVDEITSDKRIASYRSSNHVYTIFRVMGDDLQALYNGKITSVNNIINADTWYYVSYTLSGNGVPLIYINGVKQTPDSSSSGTRNYNSQPLTIGGDASDKYLDGTIDEVRISATARSGDWINTSHNNQNSHSTFYSVKDKMDTGGSDPVPELPTAILFAVGLVVLAGYIWLRRKNK